MKTVIKVQKRSAYGQVRTYPACEKANLLAVLTGKKTFDWVDIETIEALGFKIVEVGK